VIERHGYPLAVARPLAESMVLCATLATSLKYDGIFTLQISGDGPIRLLVTDLTSDGALRGYAQFDSWKLAIALGSGNEDVPDGYIPKLFGQGRLTFTVDQGQYTERYQGVVPLEGATLADCAHTYFRQSEQLPTGIKITARRSETGGQHHWHAASLMVQQMPEFDAGRMDIDAEQREDDWRKAVILMASATEKEMLDPAPSPVPSGTAPRFRAPPLRGPLPLQPRAHRQRAALDPARGTGRSARQDRPRLGEMRVLLDRIHLRRQRSRPRLRASRRGTRSVEERLVVEHRPFDVGVVENRTAACEAGTFINFPGRVVTVAGLQHQTLQPLGARHRLDARDDLLADPLAAMARPRVHALHLADAALVPLQCPAGHGRAAVPGDEDRGVGIRHLLDGQMVAVFGRRQLQQHGVQLGDERTDLVLQRRFGSDSSIHAKTNPSAPVSDSPHSRDLSQ
jgi:redox-regulated HSP33 family molecular chaperone